jgi:hypothetical protein
VSQQKGFGLSEVPVERRDLMVKLKLDVEAILELLVYTRSSGPRMY